MNVNNFDLSMLLSMAHSPVANYVIPGLTSSLIGEPGKGGTVRLFENSRDHQESIVPHSHRFDFQCRVLAGYVVNRVWREVPSHNDDSDLFEISEMRYQGTIGRYKTSPIKQAKFSYEDTRYITGEFYSMKAEEIHSIKFSRGAKVLFFEGESRINSVFIEPVVDGEVIRTMQVAPWMFKREQE